MRATAWTVATAMMLLVCSLVLTNTSRRSNDQLNDDIPIALNVPTFDNAIERALSTAKQKQLPTEEILTYRRLAESSSADNDHILAVLVLGLVDFAQDRRYAEMALALIEDHLSRQPSLTAAEVRYLLNLCVLERVFPMSRPFSFDMRDRSEAIFTTFGRRANVLQALILEAQAAPAIHHSLALWLAGSILIVDETILFSEEDLDRLLSLLECDTNGVLIGRALSAYGARVEQHMSIREKLRKLIIGGKAGVSLIALEVWFGCFATDDEILDKLFSWTTASEAKWRRMVLSICHNRMHVDAPLKERERRVFVRIADELKRDAEPSVREAADRVQSRLKSPTGGEN